jgi:uncharacterized protein (TIGR02466 family)|tara:strand:- start:21 stop:698 length:678 start_codon:yes stop_codon:yes gene_type:complete
MTEAIAIFPTGLVKPYKAPKHYMDTFDIRKYQFEQYPSETKLRTPKFNNLLLLPEMAELAEFVKSCAKDFLDNVMQVDYDDFFFAESWLNVSGKGGYQKMHNHSNSVISGCIYLQSEEGHPALNFRRQKQEFEPFFSLMEHYKAGNPNTAYELSFPCTQDTMNVFSSWMYHGHQPNPLETERIGLAWNILVNFAVEDKDLYRLSFDKDAYNRPAVFVKEELDKDS